MGIETGDQVENSLKGQFLIAMPKMADFNFSHTVTCISEEPWASSSTGCCRLFPGRAFSMS